MSGSTCRLVAFRALAGEAHCRQDRIVDKKHVVAVYGLTLRHQVTSHQRNRQQQASVIVSQDPLGDEQADGNTT
jgi:hypothetical protein